MDYFSDSYAAQRLELIAKSAYVNDAVDQLAARPDDAFDGFHFFADASSVFSQWHPAAFSLRGQAYVSSGQYFLHQKALLFGDAAAARTVLAKAAPEEQQAAGRSVRGYDDAAWRENARRFAYEGNCAKFLQDDGREAQLLATGDALLAEASPTDQVWGTGFRQNHPDASRRDVWPGTNFLGYVLTLLRQDIRQLRRLG